MVVTIQTIKIKPGYKQTEVGVIPEDWEVKQLGEIASISSGGTPNRANSTYWGGDVPWITTTQIDFNLIEKANEFITTKGLENSSAKVYNPQTLLMAMYGQGKTRGKVAVLAIAAATNQACAAITLNKGILSDYIFFNLSARYEEIRSLSNNGNQENLNITIIKNILIPLPCNTKEQQAIATALSDVDALITSLDKLIAKKRDIKQATMQQLLTGKMRLPGFSGEWEMKKLEEVGICLRGVSYNGDNDLSSYDTDDTIRLLRSNNVQYESIIKNEVQFVTSARVSIQQVLQENDILICMANGSKELVGKAGLFRVNDPHNYTFGTFMGCFRTTSIVHPTFVSFLFQTGRYRHYIANLLAGSSINNLKPSDIESIPFSFPKLAEQAAIVSVLSDMDAEIAALKQKRDKTRALRQGMMQELLTGKTRLS